MASNINLKIEWPEYGKCQKTLKEYSKWSRKQPAEIINAKQFYIARNATNMTKSADKSKIRSELEGRARDYNAPLAAVLVNRDLARKGQKGLMGAKLANMVAKRIRSATSHTNFLRSGWLPAIKILDYYNKRGDIIFVKRWAPKQAQGLKEYGAPKGHAIYARPYGTYRCWGQIENWVGQGKQKSKTVTAILWDGLRKAVNAEMQSMFLFVQRKFDQQHQRMFQKKF